MPGPLKALCPDFKAIEKRCEAAAFAKFGVTHIDRDEIKRWDWIMLATERRDLMPWDGTTWPDLDGVDPLPEVIEPWPPENAAVEFLARYRELSAER